MNAGGSLPRLLAVFAVAALLSASWPAVASCCASSLPAGMTPAAAQAAPPDCPSHAEPAADPAQCQHCDGLCGQAAAFSGPSGAAGHDGKASWSPADVSALIAGARAGPLRPPRAS